jgi:hypothetical protein
LLLGIPLLVAKYWIAVKLWPLKQVSRKLTFSAWARDRRRHQQQQHLHGLSLLVHSLLNHESPLFLEFSCLNSPDTDLGWINFWISNMKKLLGYEADHWPPSSAEVKNGGAIPPLP